MALGSIVQVRIRFDLDDPDTRQLDEAAVCFRSGGLVLYPTDTIYGLGCNPFHRKAMTRLLDLKSRPSKGLLLLIDDRSWAERLSAATSVPFYQATDRWWPGPLTVVLPAVLGLPPEILSPAGTVALRQPGVRSIRNLISLCGFPITSTSINRPGEAALSDPEQIWQQWGSRVELFLDAGAIRAAAPSTLLDLSVTPPQILRSGQLGAEIQQWITKAKR